MSRKDLAIGILSVTAVVMFVALVLLHVLSPQPAWAGAQSASAGPYVVSTQRMDDNSELLVIMNTSVQTMNYYIFNNATRRIDLLQTIDVQDLRRRAGGGARSGTAAPSEMQNTEGVAPGEEAQAEEPVSPATTERKQRNR